MGKIYSFSIMAIILSVFISTHDLFSQDALVPLLSEDSLSLYTNTAINSTPSLLAQNTQANPEEGSSGNDMLDDYQDSEKIQPVADPLYYFNYVMYTFNDVLYFALLQPISSSYKALTPPMFRKGVNNFFHNLLFPVRFVNTLLQGRINDAGAEIQIFFTNSTVGVLGFGQVAQNQFGLKTCDEDLGQTFGSYAIGNGFYLVLPVLGPSTLRDAVGLAGDYFLTPVNYVDPWELSMGIKSYDTINALSFRLGDYEALKAAAVEPYVAIRNAYIQNREKKIKE
jgi:phospholipid-binding lipoprotein MlaA